MADFGVLTNALNTITGGSEKASILICDKRDMAEKELPPKDPVSPGSAVPGAGSIPGGANVSKLKDKAKAAAQEAVADQFGIDLGEYDKEFVVQFNPATLNINGFSGGSYDTIDYSEVGKAAKATPLDTNYSLSVNLIFDQMELQNSFPLDFLDFSLTTAAKAAWKAVNVAYGGLSISVQAATEGLIAALHNPKTRYVAFAWGPLRYKGVLKSVNAQYKMFDMMGRPVRSEVALTLYLADKDIKAANGQANLGMWYGSYKKAFIDAALGSARALKIAKDITKEVLGD